MVPPTFRVNLPTSVYNQDNLTAMIISQPDVDDSSLGLSSKVILDYVWLTLKTSKSPLTNIHTNQMLKVTWMSLNINISTGLINFGLPAQWKHSANIIYTHQIYKELSVSHLWMADNDTLNSVVRMKQGFTLRVYSWILFLSKTFPLLFTAFQMSKLIWFEVLI